MIYPNHLQQPSIALSEVILSTICTVQIQIGLGEFRRLILAALKSEDSTSLSLITIELYSLQGSNASTSTTQIRLFLL